jgi:hypothetical protein
MQYEQICRGHFVLVKTFAARKIMRSLNAISCQVDLFKRSFRFNTRRKQWKVVK